MFSFFKTTEDTQFSPTQKKYIEDNIQAFNDIHTKLLAIDHQLEAYGAVGTLLFMTQILGTAPTILLLSGGSFFCFEKYANRKNLAHENQQSLKKLMSIFDGLVEAAESNLARNETFLILLQTIAPFVELEQLKINKLILNTSTEGREKILEILARPPHQLKILLPNGEIIEHKHNEQFSNLQNHIPTMFRSNKLVTAAKNIATFAIAEFNKTLYSLDKEPAINNTSQPRVN